MTDPPSPAGAPPGPVARRIAWWTLGPALIVIAGSVGAGHDQPGYPLLLVAVLSGVAALSALTATLRPRLSVLAGGTAAGVYFAVGLPNGPIFLTVPLVVFLAAQRTRPRPLLIVLVPALVVIVAGLSIRSRWHDASEVVTFWQSCGLVGVTLGAGVLGWWLTDRRTAGQEQARRTATEERLRMAQDLHDGVGHGLAVISMHAAVALHVLDKNADTTAGPHPELRRSLEVIRDTGRESLDALRVQLAVISTGSDAAGARRPAPGLPELEDLLARVRTGGLTVTRSGDPGPVPDEIGQVVYAVVQESLTNVLRHAQAGRAGVTLTRGREELVVSIQDDGSGPGGSGPPDGSGMGIAGMRDRVERLGGRLESGSTASGFRVRAHLPVPR
jgi:signal transduction histidine kinase